MEQFDRKVISKKAALKYLENYSYSEDLDSSFDEDEKHYFVENLGYLIIYEYINESVLFKSKSYYLEFMSEDFPDLMRINLEQTFKNQDSLIINLSRIIDLDISKADNLEKLKEIDSLIAKERIKREDFINNFECYFSYFMKVIQNELKPNSYIFSMYDEKNSFRLVTSSKDEYEIFLPFYKMILNQDENFSFYSLAKQIVYPYKIKLRED